MLRRGPREILLLGAIVLLPAAALALLAFRTFQGEESREAYQRTERQQQILRLLGNDLSDLVQARCTDATKGRSRSRSSAEPHSPAAAQRVSASGRRSGDRHAGCRHGTPICGVRRRPPSSGAATSRTRFKGTDGSLREAQSVSTWAQLALLRLALQRADYPDADFWLKQIEAGDPKAATESGIPIRVAAALLLVSRDEGALPSRAAGFLGQTMTQLADGLWPLLAARWISYAEEMNRAPEVDSQLRADARATASLLESLGDGRP